MTRIYDDPNHPHYGPVRRQWVIFAGLGLLGIDEAYFAEWGIRWDAHLAHHLDDTDEGPALRCITWNALVLAFPNGLTE